MCGVVARLGSGSRIESSVHRAALLLRHRGFRTRVEPAGREGFIGHVRLPIVGLGEENDQPQSISSELHFGFVGEILDFKEAPGYTGETCDVHTVHRALGTHGFSGLSQRDGFWGIAAIDDGGHLHVLTDFLAQKPMYYRADRHVQAAASEIDPLVSMGPVTFDSLYLSDVVKWGYCPDTTRTPFNEIKHLLPGEHVRIDSAGRVIRQIVDPLTPRSMYASSFKAEFVRAIRRRVESSDVPVACLTSGGLDSSIAYAIGSRYADLRPYYAIPSTANWKCDPEYARAREVTVGKDLRVVAWEDRVTDEEAVLVMQEPIDLGSLIPQIAISRAVEENVCLTGDGADEVFGGYGRSERYDSQYSDVYRELVAWHLPRLDRVMMRHCIEVRTPFLARRVVEGAMGITHDLRRKKDMLKILFKPDLPKSVLEAAKLPLRTDRVEKDREKVSRKMTRIFRSMGHYRPVDPNDFPVYGEVG